MAKIIVTVTKTYTFDETCPMYGAYTDEETEADGVSYEEWISEFWGEWEEYDLWRMSTTYSEDFQVEKEP